MELLDQAQKYPSKAENKPASASLASVGKERHARLLTKALEGDLPLKDQQLLTQAIDHFDGVIAERANSPAYHRLEKLAKMTGLSPELKVAIDTFLQKYRRLKAIPIKQKSPLTSEKRDTQVQNKSRRGGKSG